MTKKQLAVAEYKRLMAESAGDVNKEKNPFTILTMEGMSVAFEAGWDTCVALQNEPEPVSENQLTKKA